MEQPVDVAEQPVDTEEELGYGEMEAPWWVVLLEGIFAIIVGLFLLYSPASTTFFLIQVLGIFWLAGGIISILGAFLFPEHRAFKLISGILGVIAGIVILMYPVLSPFVVLTLFVIFIGVWAIINGAMKLFWGFKGGGWGMGILGVLSIILGLLLLTNILVGTLFLPWIFGFILIVGGIGAVIGGLKMRT